MLVPGRELTEDIKAKGKDLDRVVFIEVHEHYSVVWDDDARLQEAGFTPAGFAESDPVRCHSMVTILTEGNVH